MKTKLLTVVALAISIASLQAQYTTNTLSFTGASWNDDASLSGYFTVSFDPTGTPVDLLSLDVTTGDGIFLGYNYLYNVSGQSDTVNFTYGSSAFDAIQGGYPANELSVESLDGNYILNLDWQGTDPSSLYVGDPSGLHSSEVLFVPDYQIRDLSSGGGSGGTVTVEPTPEPTTFALAGLAGLGLLVFRRRK